jgi:hypothetical protein
MHKLVATQLDLISLVLKRVVTLAHGSDAQCENLDRMLSDLPKSCSCLFQNAGNGKAGAVSYCRGADGCLNGLSDQIIKLLA